MSCAEVGSQSCFYGLNLPREFPLFTQPLSPLCLIQPIKYSIFAVAALTFFFVFLPIGLFAHRVSGQSDWNPSES